MNDLAHADASTMPALYLEEELELDLELDQERKSDHTHTHKLARSTPDPTVDPTPTTPQVNPITGMISRGDLRSPVPPMPKFKPGETRMVCGVEFKADPTGNESVDWAFWCMAHELFGPKVKPIPYPKGSEGHRYEQIRARALSPSAEMEEIRKWDQERLKADAENFAAVRGGDKTDKSASFMRQAEKLKKELLAEGATKSIVRDEYSELMGYHLYPDAQQYARDVAWNAIETHGLAACRLAMVELLNDDSLRPEKRCKFFMKTAANYAGAKQ